MWGFETTRVPKAKPEAPDTPCPAPRPLLASELTQELPLLWVLPGLLSYTTALSPLPTRAGGGLPAVQSSLLCLPRPRLAELGLRRAR